MNSKKIIISDAGPLIAFARIQQLDLLPKMFSRVIVTQQVFRECTVDQSKPGAKEIIEKVTLKKLEIHQQRIIPKDELDFLGEGEASSIELATNLKAALLIDERLGRSIAINKNLKIIGTAGVLVIAKKKKLIKSVIPSLQQLSEIGYFISQRLIKEILIKAGEKR